MYVCTYVCMYFPLPILHWPRGAICTFAFSRVASFALRLCGRVVIYATRIYKYVCAFVYVHILICRLQLHRGIWVCMSSSDRGFSYGKDDNQYYLVLFTSWSRSHFDVLCSIFSGFPNPLHACFYKQRKFTNEPHRCLIFWYFHAELLLNYCLRRNNLESGWMWLFDGTGSAE